MEMDGEGDEDGDIQMRPSHARKTRKVYSNSQPLESGALRTRGRMSPSRRPPNTFGSFEEFENGRDGGFFEDGEDCKSEKARIHSTRTLGRRSSAPAKQRTDWNSLDVWEDISEKGKEESPSSDVEMKEMSYNSLAKAMERNYRDESLGKTTKSSQESVAWKTPATSREEGQNSSKLFNSLW